MEASMIRRRITTTLTLAGLAAAGVLAALTLAPTANAWDWHSLPAGYSILSSYTTVCHIATDPTCVGGEGSICTHVTVGAGDRRFAEADCLPSFQADLDAFVDSTICQVNPAAGGSACAPPSTSAPPTTTTTQPGTTTTAAEPPPPPPAATTTQATTTTAATTTTTDPTADALAALAARIDALEQKIAALTTRVDRLELAGEASWLAYQQSIEKGDPPEIAAALARGTWLNAVYGLGAFA